MVFVLDTHPLVWFLEGSPRLSGKAKDVLLDDNHLKVVPSIVLAEIFYLVARKRIRTGIQRALALLRSSRNSIIYPLDENVIERLSPSLDIHDGIVCATALVYGDLLKKSVSVVTKDEAITSLGLVSVLWR